MELNSCDTFVVLPPHTTQGVVFGKNSDRPSGEVQELLYIPATESNEPIKCTYVEVASSGSTRAVILSKPWWMWGAEMGANECGVAIGNEAIWTNDNEDDHDPSVKRLLGMDLVRLGLERSSTALEAVEIITELLEKYGQGGPCSITEPDLTYHNSFLIADPNSAWVLETSGKHWVAQQVTDGYRNISNILTITTKFDKHSEGLMEYAKSKGFWDGEGEFNFAKAFSGQVNPSSQRLDGGLNLLRNLTKDNNFRETDMFHILRDKESEICRSIDAHHPTQGSQVSILTSTKPSVHWFTATPDTSKSIFKPFIFTPNAVISKHTKSSDAQEDHAHLLYQLHREFLNKNSDRVQDLLRGMESECISEVDAILSSGQYDLSELDDLMKDCVETECKFYR